ncbi:hypothetical protein ACMGD3_05850 [Lysinibacillus sphaericus]|uniref:hypothetical protein n=1 Tax=Lysinibacillus sphaericus TaxID=1421 RepID=UPI003F79E7B6
MGDNSTKVLDKNKNLGDKSTKVLDKIKKSYATVKTHPWHSSLLSIIILQLGI